MPLDIARIQAICIDVDGTLRETDDLYVSQLQKYLRPFRFLFPGKDTHRFARWFIMRVEHPANFLITLPDRLGIDDELASLVERLTASQTHDDLSNYHMVADCEAMLIKLSQQFPLSIVTARGEKKTMLFLNKFDLTKYFNTIVTAVTAQRTKPHPAPVLWAAEKLGVTPQQCLMVGDTTFDVLAGKRAGAQTVGVLSGFGERPELEAAGADAILASVAQLPELLKLSS